MSQLAKNFNSGFSLFPVAANPADFQDFKAFPSTKPQSQGSIRKIFGRDLRYSRVETCRGASPELAQRGSPSGLP